MRPALYEKLTTDAILLGLVPAVRHYERGSMLDIPETPFVVVAWGIQQSLGPGLSTRDLEIWVHQQRGDYSVCDQYLARVITVLQGISNYSYSVPAENSRLSTVTWEATSGDLDDRDYQTNTRHADFRVTGRGR